MTEMTMTTIEAGFRFSVFSKKIKGGQGPPFLLVGGAHHTLVALRWLEH
jgi:hypothetical protein